MATTSRSKAVSQDDFAILADFRYQLRRFLRFSEQVCQSHGVTHLQYQLLLQIKGFPGREWATVAELAERLQSHHHGVVALVSRCEKAELLERRAGRDDRRCVEIHLRPRGQVLVARLALLHREQLGDLRQVLAVLP